MKHSTRNATVFKFSTAIVTGLLATALAQAQHRSPWLPKANTEEARNRVGEATQDQDKYVFVTVDPPGEAFYTTITAVSGEGVAIGQYCADADCNVTRSFIWRDGRFTDLRYPGASDMYMWDINLWGFVFGSEDWTKAAVLQLATGKWEVLPDVVYQNHSYPYAQGLRMTDFGIGLGQSCDDDNLCVTWIWDGRNYSFPPSFPGTASPWTGLLAINDWGQLVGQYQDADGLRHAYIQHGTQKTDLNVPSYKETVVNGINNFGDVLLEALNVSSWVGWIPVGTTQPYVWKRGASKPTALPNFPGAAHTAVEGFNDRGDYSGRWDDGKNTHGFIAFRK